MQSASLRFKKYATIALLACLLPALVPAARPSPLNDLPTRYQRLACAVVQVQSDNETGTAFFVDDSGTLATVAHVLYDKKFRLVGNNVVVDLTKKPGLRIKIADGQVIPLNVPEPSAGDQQKALFDLASVKTGLHSPCFIPLGNSDKVRVGEHLIAIGFPASATAGVFYEGFLSSRHARLPSFGSIENRPEFSSAPRYEVLRVQMPLTPGSSGSPIITDGDTIVGIQSEAPIVMAKDVQQIAMVFASNPGVSSGVLLSGFDVTKILGELAWTVQEFESPGAGLAVPVSDMQPADFVHAPVFAKPELPAHPK